MEATYGETIHVPDSGTNVPLLFTYVYVIITTEGGRVASHDYAAVELSLVISAYQITPSETWSQSWTTVKEMSHSLTYPVFWDERP
jgi:hypothetical protein